MSTSNKIFISMVVGILFGLVFGQSMSAIKFIGDAWINFLKMTIAPFIVLTIMTSIGQQKDTKTIGKAAIFIVVFYAISTTVASVIGILTATIMKPGIGFAGFAEVAESTMDTSTADFSIQTFIKGMFADNFFKPFVDGNILQVLVIGLFLGFIVLKLPEGDQKDRILDWFKNMHLLFSKLITAIINFGPIGVFCLMSAVMGQYGTDFLTSIGSFTLVLYIALIAHVVFWYLPLVALIGKANPIRWLKQSMPLIVYTLSTCSSAAAIPISLNICDDMKIDRKISSFTIPLGSQISMDGMGVFFPCILLFAGQATGIEFTFFQLMQMVLMGTIIASGGGGIPNAGLVKVLIMIEAFGVPTEMGVIIGAFYRIFDMGVTTNNCLEDIVGATLANRLFGTKNKQLENA